MIAHFFPKFLIKAFLHLKLRHILHIGKLNSPTIFRKSFFLSFYNFEYFSVWKTLIPKYQFTIIHWKLIRKLKYVSEICASLSAFVKVWHSFENERYWYQKFCILSPDLCPLKITNLHKESKITKTKNVRLL